MTFRPMLAATPDDLSDYSHIKFPVLVSPKIDGIRCVIREGEPVTRTLKPIPNHYVREKLTGLPNFDGELTVGPMDEGLYDRTQSSIMSHEGEPEFTYHVFDHTYESPVAALRIFAERIQFVYDRAPMYGLTPVRHVLIRNLEDLLALEEKWLPEGYEGIMIRDPNGPYKHGRSTLKEGYLVKMIRRRTDEAIVICDQPLMRNHNELEADNFGLAKRSKQKANLVADDTRIGFLACCWADAARLGEAEFEVGTGYTDAQRLAFRKNVPQVITIEYRGLTKTGKPRFPSFKGVRHDIDEDLAAIDDELEGYEPRDIGC